MTVSVSDWFLWLLALIFMVMAAFNFLLSPRWQRPQWQWLSLACVIATFVRRVVFPVALIVMSLSLTIGCATVDQFNKASADIVRDAITANEQAQCKLHPQPCLSDDQFKAVALELHNISVAGQEFTKLRIAGKASVTDINTFLTTVASEIATLSKTFGPTSAIGKVLVELTKLQQKAVDLLGKGAQ